ncbi:MAG TPA: hypothetical protein VGG39_04205 [Polyangiaceae bacterium]|jgi:hypothetical protein
MRCIAAALALCLLPTTACLELSTGGTDAGTSGTSSSSGATTATCSSADCSGSSGSSGGATSGTGCTTDPQSGVTLCEEITACPGVDVDQGAFPGCGFRMNASSTFDLECGCGDSLCPIGTPTSCASAQQLLDQGQSSIVVCEELDQGTCLPLSGSTSSSGASSTCDKTCESECAGEPSCIQLCGC